MFLLITLHLCLWNVSIVEKKNCEFLRAIFPVAIIAIVFPSANHYANRDICTSLYLLLMDCEKYYVGVFTCLMVLAFVFFILDTCDYYDGYYIILLLLLYYIIL